MRLRDAVIRRPTVVALLLCNMLMAPGVTAVWLNLPASGTKCVSEEIQPNVVVLADYAVVHEGPADGLPIISAKVTSPYGNTLHHKEHVTAAKDWDSVAKKDKIEGVELELTKLEAAVQAIHANLLYLKSREAEMREVSERTNSRVAWFSIMSLSVCIVVSILQLWHLKGYFQKKKLI
ncbi:hypothetical protein OPV22_014072 [Ensete ventricosum]|uniref:GOLD domain-containing protein n=1 Tax=Ensete ventricosum TaxID=4639 RepID=A0AAV8R5B0_ENSVE|nr:hypothetical protein OPV22_014072 [Ensete ventricosum]